MFGLPITSADLAAVLFLVFLEGVLSVDNAIVLALIASQLPKHQQKRALTYGLVGAVVFRFISLFFVTQLMQWTWVKFVGGGYLVLLSVKHFLSKHSEGGKEGSQPKKQRSFWMTVLVIELMDIAFAVDSILAAVALSSKFWVVFTGGILGVAMMRFAASVFIKLLAGFPRLEASAFLLVALIGGKLIIDGLKLPGVDFHSSQSIAFWIFWVSMGGFLAYGFLPAHPKVRQETDT